MCRESHLNLSAVSGAGLVASIALVVLSACAMPSITPTVASVPTPTATVPSTAISIPTPTATALSKTPEPVTTPTPTLIAPTETPMEPTLPAATIVPAQTPVASARYELTFEATWSEATHPIDFPPNPHFSGLIGASHSSGVYLWQEGETASPGVENMAETGGKSPLDREIDSLVSGGRACEKISGGGINHSPGVVTVMLTVSQECPLVSVVSMIAPSPDWFVGVSGMSLYENGAWIEQKVVELYAYDAGTDSGRSYDSPDELTESPEGIRRIETEPLLVEGSVPTLGTFTFSRLDE